MERADHRAVELRGGKRSEVGIREADRRRVAKSNWDEPRRVPRPPEPGPGAAVTFGLIGLAGADKIRFAHTLVWLNNVRWRKEI
jgi:hypothetical protein